MLTIGVTRLALAGAPRIASAAEASAQPPEAVTSESTCQQWEGLEQITVSAQRRTESLQDVPISVQAVTSAQLSQAAFSDARFGIRVNALALGYLAIELNSDFLNSETGKEMVRRIPQRRAGRLEELDGPLLLLAFDVSS